MHPLTRPLTTDELRQADADTRDRYTRILTLVTQNYAPWPLAAAAVADADSTQKEQTTDAHTKR